MALSHGSVPSLGLGPLVEELVAPARFAALAPPLRCLLLARLPALLRALSAKRAAAVVASLPGLLAAAAAAGGSGGAGLGANAWDGEWPGSFPWDHPAGLDDPWLVLPWLVRVRGALAAGGGAGGGATGGGGGAGRDSLLLGAHCWVGLLALCSGWRAKDNALGHRWAAERELKP